MANEGDVLTDITPEPQPGEPHPGANGSAENMPQVGVVAQYIKDLSVENPNAPHSYNWGGQPQLDVQFNIGAEALGTSGDHEVTLKMTCSAKTDQGALYLVDLDYCGIAVVRNIPEEMAHAFLYAEAPRLLFPFARRVIADATRDAGFAPLVLDPVDFGQLYQQQLAARAQQQGEGGEMTPAGEA